MTARATPPPPGSGTRQVTAPKTSDRARLLLAAAVFVGTFAFRLWDPVFTNDHFRWIAGGREILVHDQLPFRDFHDPGYFLQHYASAAAQWVFGPTLLGEGLLSISCLSAGVAVSFWLAARAARSIPIGLLVTILLIATYPRLYHYPKIFLYVFGLLTIWGYVDRPTLSRLLVVALATVVAFLFRHDHAVYVGLAVVVALIATHWKDGYRVLLRRLAWYAASVAVALLPFLVFIQLNGGIVEYFGSGAEFSRQEAVRVDLGRQPEVVFDPAAPWSIIQPANAIPWLYYLYMALPVIAIAVLLIKRRRPRIPDARFPSETAKILAAVVLCAVAGQVLLRNPLETRLAEAAAPIAVLAGWLLGQWRDVAVRPRAGPETDRHIRARSPRRGPRFTVPAARTALHAGAAIALLGITALSIVSVAELGPRLAQVATLTNPATLRQQAISVAWRLTLPPTTREWATDSSGLQPLARYVRACTKPTDRVIVVAKFAPEFYFYSGRGLAAGGIFPNPNRTLQKVQSQSVPIVIVSSERYEALRRFYAHFYEYLDEHYRVVQESNYGGRDRYRVLVDERLTASGTYRELSLPCYR